MAPELAGRRCEKRAAGTRELYLSLFPPSRFLRPGVELRGYVAKSLWDATRLNSK